MDSPTVLVVGAGPSGLVLALSLLKNGVSVRIVDKDTALHVGQRGAGIMPRSLELFNLLGVLAEVVGSSAVSLPMRSYELPGGTEPLRAWRMSPLEEPTSATPWPNAAMLAQSRTVAILRSYLQTFSCDVELGSRLVSFDQKTDHIVAHLAKTVDGVEVQEAVKTGWLVGADGAHSTVRKQLDLNFVGETRNERFVIADVHLKGLDMHNIHLFGGGPSGTILIWPSEVKTGDLMTVYIVGKDVDYEKLSSNYDAFKEYFYAKMGRPDIVLGDCTWITDYRPSIRMVDKCQEGRAFVVGDAAHVHPLTGGQGLNTSIQDSMNLGWKLALVAKGQASPDLLLSYTEERLPVIAEVLNISTAILNKTSAAAKGDQDHWKRGGPLSQLGINYRWSSVIVDQRARDTRGEESEPGVKDSYGQFSDAVVHAGDRAPDASHLVNLLTKEEKTLFQIFGASFHTAIFFPARDRDGSRLLDCLKRYPPEFIRLIAVVTESEGYVDLGESGTDTYHDSQGHAYNNYSMGDMSMVVIVRPDGIVGAIVHDEVGLQTYFQKLTLQQSFDK
ncbi:monooxygenase [Hygrophoropsis aurantiaca]|uniref:Monooxygenase n=1 Tax=Hygrophoropsis aurantiaca TaxID=72124 RepID=A0ACB8A5R4_9AGAM|nr:monooxygenase [Hygrophoropsis aurantiaca]